MTDDLHGWEHKPIKWENQVGIIKTQLVPAHNSNTHNNNFYNHNFNSVDVDLIVVLAGGLTDDGQLHQWVLRRLELGYSIYKEHPNKDNIYILCLGGGSYHKPPILNSDKYVVHESTACADYLINLGVDPKRIMKEWSSYDTVANGFFFFTNYQIPMEFQNIVVITSEFHMDRAKSIFLWMKSLEGLDQTFNIYFAPASDRGFEDKLLGRLEREINSLEKLRKDVFPKIKSLKELAIWFYIDHKAYSCFYHDVRELELTPEIFKTY